MEAWRDVPGDAAAGLLLIADHAANDVPDGIDLGVPAAVMEDHVAIDIGVAPLARALCRALACPGILAGVSRLVIDFNREEDAAGLIPQASDGHAIPGNRIDAGERRRRIEAYWRPYHRHISNRIDVLKPNMLISLHSFTPALRTDGSPRPWQIGILYNDDARAAERALPLLAEAGIVAGDNLPYSGKVLNATMNAHGEARGLPYLGIEVRQDLIADAAGVAVWAGRLAPVIRAVGDGL